MGSIAVVRLAGLNARMGRTYIFAGPELLFAVSKLAAPLPNHQSLAYKFEEPSVEDQ